MNKNDIMEWLRAAGIRAVRTFAEAMLAYIGTGALVLGDVNWLAALSAGAFGAITAILLALAGLPEVRLASAQREDAPTHDDELEPDEQDGVGDTDEGVM